MTKVSFEYAGSKVELTDDFKFLVVALDKQYQSAQEARDAILAAEKRITDAKRLKLNLAVIDDEGRPHTITGVHAGRQIALYTPKLDQSDSNYPDVSWIHEAIAEYHRLQDECAKLSTILYDFDLKKSTTDCHVGATYESVTKAHAAALKKAEKTTLAEQLEKFKGVKRIRY